MGFLLLFGLIYLVLGSVIAACLYKILINSHELWLVATTATSAVRKAKQLAGRRVELKGRVECDEPLTSPATRTPCIYYAYKLERRERVPAKGDEAATERWVDVVATQEVAAFHLRDKTGRMIVAPELPAASLHPASTVTEHGAAFEGAERYPGIDVAQALVPAAGHETLAFRVTERLIPLGQQLYVLGQARRREDDQVVVDTTAGASMLLSVHDEPALMKRLFDQTVNCAAAAAVCTLIGYLPWYFLAGR